jgi:competence protein ComEC
VTVGALVGAGLWLLVAVELALATHLGVGPALAVAAAGLVGAYVVGVRTPALRRACAIAGLLVVLGAGVVTWRVVPLVSGSLAPLRGTSAVIDADLVLTSDPQARTGRTSGSRRADDGWQVDAETLGWSTSAGDRVDADLPVRLLATADVGALLPGTRVRAVARVLDADPVRGRAATLVAREVVVVSDAPPLQAAAGAVRASLRASVSGRPPDEAGLLPGLVVGDTSQVPPDLDAAMRASSLAHLVAVSGGNVAVVVLLALGGARLCRIRRGRAQVLLVALAVAAYVVVARPQPSVVRAAGMTAVVLAAVLLDLRVRPRDALGASVAVLVLVDPFLALSIGFAMSALATAALVEIADRAAVRDPPARHPVLRALAGVVAVSAVAQLAVAPLVVGLGGGLPVGGVVANLLAAPAVAPATTSGLAAAAVGLVSPAAAAVVALPGAWAVGWIARVARATAGWTPPLPWPGGWSGGLLMVLVLALVAVAAAYTVRLGGRLARACLAVAAAGALVVLAPPPSLPGAAAWPPPGWRVVLCDVGQGDAVVLSDGPGEAVVVDTGSDPDAVDRCLRRLGIARVPLLVLTHFHADHVEGVPGVLRGRDVGMVVVSPLAEPAGEERRVRRWLAESGAGERVAAPGDAWSVGGVRLRVVWPTRLVLGQGSDPNNASVAMVADVGGTSVLLDGDLETAAQDAVIASGGLEHVDVVKVPHHGSAKQSAGWAATTRPAVALIGVGRDNDYGHPSPGTVAAYLRVGALVGRTDLDGDVAVVVDDAGRLGVVRRGR